MTFDNEDELCKIKRIFPDARLVLRIFADDPTSLCRLGKKFGAPLHTTYHLLELAKQYGLDVIGISFHVGSGSRDPSAFRRGVADARIVYDHAGKLGIHMRLLDVGGGFTDEKFEEQTDELSRALADYFGTEPVEIIAEPGRFFASGSATLFCKAIGRRVDPATPKQRMLYINDGVYGNLMNAIIEPPIPTPRRLEGLKPLVDPLSTASSQKAFDSLAAFSSSPPDLFNYVVWGRTCDSADCVITDCKLPDIQCNDWLAFPNMGGTFHPPAPPYPNVHAT